MFMIAANLLPYGSLRIIGCVIGNLYFYMAFKKRIRMINEFKELFPDADQKYIKSIVRRFFTNYVLDKFDVFYYSSLNSKNINSISDIKGAEYLDHALKGGKGAVIMHAHFGNPQMLMPALGHRGYRVRQVGLAPDDVYKGVREIEGGRPEILAFLWLKMKERFEKSLPVDFIHIGRTSLKGIFDALEKNEIIAMSVDGVHGDKFVWDFLGRKTRHFMVGAAKIAIKNDSPVLPLFVIRNDDGRHVVVIEPPIVIDDKDEKKDRAIMITSKFLKILEGYVREYPWLYARYFGFHNVPFFEEKDSND